MQIGISSEDITPKTAITIAGQFRIRYGEYTHDPLTINAAALCSEGVQVILISCDLCFLPYDFTKKVKEDCAKEIGIRAESVLVACTHTHLGPCTNTLLPGSMDESFMNNLHSALVRVAKHAIQDLEEVEVYAGKGWIDQMGFNRQGLHHDGKVDMYYGSWNEGFEGVEGPRDGEVGVIFAKRPNGDVKVVIPSFSTHPNSVEGESYYSADLVGSVRIFLKRNLGDNVAVVYLTGAAGNTAPSQLENNQDYHLPWRDEEGWKRSGLYLGSEIIKTIASTIDPMPNPTLKLEQTVVKIPIRKWPENFKPEERAEGVCRDYYTDAYNDWPRMLKEESPVDVNINVLRIGSAAICTNPAELFVEHGLSIKKDSPADVTIISELTDGYIGYIPTTESFKRGGYNTWPASSSKLEENAGDVIVKNTLDLLKEAFSV